ncbi:hypothetical protein [Pseudomonas syringae group genomosp. 3]|uniref:hypothetical protein n=1 Tax=Pseudomonas syringae group genomosp. 3 TaxID=251701 RepID=UPI000A85548A|nr:hypothetical protein [Pseudomonas syringae group genomosp. 3]
MPTLTYHEKLGALPARLRKAAGVRTTLSKCHFNVLYTRGGRHIPYRYARQSTDFCGCDLTLSQRFLDGRYLRTYGE